MSTLSGSTAAADARAAGGSTDPAAVEHLAVVRRFLNALGVRVRWVRAAAGLLVLLAIALGLLAVFVVADHAWRGGVPAGWLPFAAPIWLALLLIVGGAARRRVRRRIDARWIAQRAEHAFAVPHNALLNAVELCDQPQYAYASDAALRHAARCVQRLDPAAAPPERTPRAARGLLAGVVLAWLAFALLTPKSVWISLGRFFGLGWPAPTATRIETIRPAVGAVMHAGEPLVFEFVTHGRQPRQAELAIAPAPAADGAGADHDHAWTKGDGARPDGDASRAIGAAVPIEPRSVSLRPEPAGEGRQRWGTTLAPHEVQADLTYAMSAGDAVARGRVRVVPQPAIVGFEIALQPPGVADAGVIVVTDPNLLVPRGTRATIAMWANTPVVDPILVLRTAAGESRALLRIDPEEACRAAATLTVHEAGAYRIEFSDAWKWPYRDPHMFTIRVQDAPAADAPPAGDAPTGAGAPATAPNPEARDGTPGGAGGDTGDTPGGAAAEPGPGAASGAAAGEPGEGGAGAVQAPGGASGGESAGASGAAGSKSASAPASSDAPSADGGGASDEKNANAGGGDNSSSAGGGESGQASGDAEGQRDDKAGGERNENADGEGNDNTDGSGNRNTDGKGNTQTGGASNDNAGGQRSDDSGREGRDGAAGQGNDNADAGGNENSGGEPKQGDRGANSGKPNAGEGDGDRGKRGSGGGEATGGDGDDDSRAGDGSGNSPPQAPNAADQPEDGAAAQPEDGAGAPPSAAGPSPLPGGGRAAGNDPVGRVLRGDPPSEQELVDAGVPPIMARLHAGALRAAAAAAQRSPLANAPRTGLGADAGSRDAQRGVGLSADAGGATGTAEDSIQRRLDRIRPPGRRVAPPGLQQALDAYYRALAARRARGEG